MIRAYEQKFDCRLVVLIDAILQPSITLFEDLIYDANPDENLQYCCIRLAVMGKQQLDWSKLPNHVAGN